MQKYSFILNLTRKPDFSANKFFSHRLIFLPQISQIIYHHDFLFSHTDLTDHTDFSLNLSCSEANNKNQ